MWGFVWKTAELNDISAAVGHQGKGLYSTMSVISLGDVMTECLSIFWWYTCLLLSIHFGGTDHITETTSQINQCIHVDAESVSGSSSVLFSFFLLHKSLSALPHCVFISVSALLPLSVYFVCGVGALYLFYRRQIPGVCIFSQHANCCLKCGKILVFVFVIFMINFLAAVGGVWLHCC